MICLLTRDGQSTSPCLGTLSKRVSLPLLLLRTTPWDRPVRAATDLLQERHPLESRLEVLAMVLDPFCECATTLVAAETLGRRWAGIDLSPLAAGVVDQRLREHHGAFGQMSLAVVGRQFVDLGVFGRVIGEVRDESLQLRRDPRIQGRHRPH